MTVMATYNDIIDEIVHKLAFYSCQEIKGAREVEHTVDADDIAEALRSIPDLTPQIMNQVESAADNFNKNILTVYTDLISRLHTIEFAQLVAGMVNRTRH